MPPRSLGSCSHESRVTIRATRPKRHDHLSVRPEVTAKVEGIITPIAWTFPVSSSLFDWLSSVGFLSPFEVFSRPCTSLVVHSHLPPLPINGRTLSRLFLRPTSVT
ncbi:hypothetical protein PGTUg99_026062 [Puccinia graminis f. sp. tritici]|uniref:Uncharacterized protein n=1 Tax=Puccinia graminis f. sp. tritici TaxID=56615 RepID=A0A5B0RN74_PUCGR|nr:hypothetical protein PGTUg99_026062 [Puccinia graminis f. sp. tritici]